MPSEITFWKQMRGLLSTLSASAGRMPTANLGTGTADANTVLRGDQTYVNLASAVAATADVAANTAKTSNATHTGDVTGATALTIAAGVVTLANQANMATASVVYRKTGGTGVPEVQPLATLKTDLGLTGTNAGDITINALSSTSYTIAVGTAGVDVEVDAAVSTVTINIPSASSSARGVVTTGAQTIAGAKTFGQVLVTPVSDAVAITSGGFAGLTVNQQEWRTPGNAVTSSIDSAGRPMFLGSMSVISTFHTTMWNNGAFGWASTGSVNTTSALETALFRDGGAGLVGVRNGTTPHRIQVYNTWSSAGSNFERGVCGFDTNVFTIGSYAGGTGTLRDIRVGVTGNKLGFYGTTAVTRQTTGVSAGAFVANSSGIANDSATFGGYTIAQIAAALRNLGLLT